MLPIFLEKGAIWIKSRNVYRNYRKLPAEILVNFCTSTENHIKLHKKDSDTNSNPEILENNEVIDLNETPLPEEPTTCCMSGCANCVWLEYAEKMSEHFKDGGETAIQEINTKINDPNIRAFLLQELRMRKL